MKISVALCTYNGDKFIADQLNSILEQTVSPHEIVLLDDGSTDATLDTVAAFVPLFEKCGTRLDYRRNQENVGYIKNFEMAVSACSGDIILLCDQDDVWSHDKVATLVGCFAPDTQKNLMLVYSDAEVVDAELQPLGFTQSEALDVTPRELALLRHDRGFEALLPRNLVTGATVAFRRELLGYALPFPSTWIHDEWLAIIAAAVGRIHFCDTPLVKYRQHGSNQIGMRRRYLAERLRSMFRVRGQFYIMQVERAETLKARLETVKPNIDPRKLERLNDRLCHVRFRAALPPSRLARIAPAMVEWRAGRYRAYSNGFRAVIRDLFEPT
jgi:glycosyltransferase involved in cell wall biosynthesis